MNSFEPLIPVIFFLSRGLPEPLVGVVEHVVTLVFITTAVLVTSKK